MKYGKYKSRKNMKRATLNGQRTPFVPSQSVVLNPYVKPEKKQGFIKRIAKAASSLFRRGHL